METGNRELRGQGGAQVSATLISACLVGRSCRYDARPGDTRSADGATPVCPEVAGGLTTPRPRAEIVGGDGYDVLDGRARVVTDTGVDVTAAYIAGASEVLATAEAIGANRAVLQDGSPSCGSSRINDGSFTKTRRPGAGVAAAMLDRAGIQIMPA